MSEPVVFITGASSGLGKGLAIQFAKDGYKVALAARRLIAIEMIADSLSKQGFKAIALQCDVTQKESVQAAIQHCLTTWGRIDIMVANAGISLPTPGTTLSSDTFKQLWDTNVTGALYCYEAVIPTMIQQRSGHLVSIASLAGFKGLPEAGGYSSSKAALSILTESLRIDLKPQGIKVSLIQPGFIKTPMTDRNRYWMPFILNYEAGVNRIYKAILKKKPVYAFPWPLVFIVYLAKIMPTWLYDVCISGRKNDKAL